MPGRAKAAPAAELGFCAQSAHLGPPEQHSATLHPSTLHISRKRGGWRRAMSLCALAHPRPRGPHGAAGIPLIQVFRYTGKNCQTWTIDYEHNGWKQLAPVSIITQ